MQKRVTLGVIGGGFMAQAIVKGAILKKYLRADEILVSEPDAGRRTVFSDLGIGVCCDNCEAAESCDYLLLAVKPQVFPVVAEEIKRNALPVLISIMAGKTRERIRHATGAQKIARIMPNLPCSVGAGMAGMDTSWLSESEATFVRGLFQAVGEVVEVKEDLLNAVTGVSGSGPAYVYLFYRSLVQAGVSQGLNEEQAAKLTAQTIIGGMEMLRVSGKSPDELIAAVSSKGGTTLAALDSFAKDDFSGSVERAVAAAVQRAKELSE